MKERVGRMKRLAAVGAATLALTGCSSPNVDRQPINVSPATSSSTDMIIGTCEKKPIDRRILPHNIELQLLRCSGKLNGTGPSIPARRILVIETDTKIAHVTAEQESPDGTSIPSLEVNSPITDKRTNECEILNAKTEGDIFVQADLTVVPCSSLSSTLTTHT